MQKLFFKIMGSMHVMLYRLSGGRIGNHMSKFDVLLLTTVGRKTGQVRVNPLAYFMDDADYIIVASTGGMPKNPGWYFNLQAQPDVHIQVRDKLLQVHASTVTSEERPALWQKVITTEPMFDSYRQKTSREIPLVRLRVKGTSL